MSWQILWALVFGFYLSATVEALVRKDTIARLVETGPVHGGPAPS
jgi:uncharacterized membrane protein YraQ (UPF0718 family)